MLNTNQVGHECVVGRLATVLALALVLVSCALSSDTAGSNEQIGGGVEGLCEGRVTLTSSQSPVTSSTLLTAGAVTCGAGESPEYLFLYRGYTAKRWITLRDWSPNPTANWTVLSLGSGQYWVSVLVRAQGSAAQYETRKTISLLVGRVCQAVTLATDLPSPQAIGTNVTLSANATCTDGAVPSYQFEVGSPSGSFSVLSAYQPTATALWNTSSLLPGTYTLKVSAQGYGNATDESRARREFRIFAACTRPLLTLSPNEGVPGGTVELDAGPSTCSAGLLPQYRFSYRLEGAKTFQVIQEFSSASHAVWPLANVPPGNHRLRVEVRPSDGSMDFVARRDVFLPVRTCSLTHLTASPPSPIAPGTAVTLQTGATCEPGITPEYRFSVRLRGAETFTVLQDFSAASTGVWSTEGLDANDYELLVDVRDATQSGDPADSALIGVTLGGSCTAPHYVSARVEPPGATTQTVTLTAWPRRGAPPCSAGTPEYRFLYRAPNGAETVIRDYAPERLGTFQIATPPAGTYQLVAQVRAQGSASPFQTEATVSATLGYACSVPEFVPEAQRLEDPLVRVTIGWQCAAGTPELLPFYRAVGDEDWTALPSVVPSGSSPWALVTWDTTGLEPGQYELRVDVRAAGHEISGSATRVIALCAPGLLRNAAGECVDVDECTVLPGRYGCDPATRCTNTVGSHVCGPCPADYAGDGESGCVQTSEQYVAAATGGFGRDFSRHPWEGHICALRADGTLRCWGRNNEKQSEVPAGTYTAVTAGTAHTCALEIDGSATCWGSNDAGQAAPPAGVFTELAAGFQHTCGLRPDGSIVCWGANDYAQSTPPAGAFRALAAGERHSCALSEQGQLSCWGGSLGAPTVLPGAFESVAAGPWETCAIHEDGTLQCWNFRDGGSAAPYPTNVKFERIAVGAPLTCGVLEGGSLRCWNAGYQNAHNTPRGTFESVVAGGAHACALDGEGHLRCWSEEYWDASVAGGTFEAISGTWYMCRLHASGEMSCWGSNLYGDAEAPEGTFTSIEGHCGLRADGFVRCKRQGIQPFSEPLARLIPSNDNLCGLRADGTLLCADTQHATPPSGPFLDAFAATSGGCGIRPGNTVECWGANAFGEATPPAGEFASLSGGLYYLSCGVRVDGTLACWGYNSHGQRTPPPGQFRSVTVGWEHACAIREDETVACWGDNSHGQATPPPGAFRMLALSRWYSCGLRTDGKEVCWGAVLR